MQPSCSQTMQWLLPKYFLCFCPFYPLLFCMCILYHNLPVVFFKKKKKKKETKEKKKIYYTRVFFFYSWLVQTVLCCYAHWDILFFSEWMENQSFCKREKECTQKCMHDQHIAVQLVGIIIVSFMQSCKLSALASYPGAWVWG